MTFESNIGMPKVAFIAFSLFLFTSFLDAQPLNAQAAHQGFTVLAEIIDGDTFPVKYLPHVTIVEEKRFRSDYEKRRWERLKFNVKKVYPYAKLAAELLEKYSGQIEEAETDRERKKYFKKIAKELLSQYGDEIKNMTTTQGRILVKLIDRETGETSYEIVQEFRGKISAFLWQSISKLFGQNLKSRYDASGEDAEIESIIHLVEAGVI